MLLTQANTWKLQLYYLFMAGLKMPWFTAAHLKAELLQEDAWRGSRIHA